MCWLSSCLVIILLLAPAYSKVKKVSTLSVGNTTDIAKGEPTFLTHKINYLKLLGEMKSSFSQYDLHIDACIHERSIVRQRELSLAILRDKKPRVVRGRGVKKLPNISIGF
jgi:hypothetical protein